MKSKIMLLLVGVCFLFCGCDKAPDVNQSSEKTLEQVQFMNNLKITKLDDFLYEIYYDDYDYEAISKQFAAKFKDVSFGACSSVRNGNFHGRNYDWMYDYAASFIVRTPAVNGRHASIGVAGGIKQLTPEVIDSEKYSDAYKILPFMMQDGINDAGVVVNINVVPVGDAGYTVGTNPNAHNMNIINAVRYVLDWADDVDSAIELLNNLNVYAPHTDALNIEGHFMISDKNKTVVVEYVNNKMVVVRDNANIMTNFYLLLPLTPHAMGIERYDILKQNYDIGSTRDGMIELMKKVYYTKAYDLNTDPFWYSEFSADYGADSVYGDLTKDSPRESYKPIIDIVRGYFNKHFRNGKTWQTVHMSVYDIDNRSLTVIPQESDKEFKFTL